MSVRWKPAWTWIVVATIAYALLLILLSGCFKEERQATSMTTERREFQETGTQAGVPFEKQGVETRTVRAEEEATTRTGMDPQAVAAIASTAAKAAVSGATGGSAFGIGELLTALGLGGGGVGGIAAAWLQAKRAQRAEDDAAEGWAKAEQHALRRQPPQET